MSIGNAATNHLRIGHGAVISWRVSLEQERDTLDVLDGSRFPMLSEDLWSLNWSVWMNLTLHSWFDFTRMVDGLKRMLEMETCATQVMTDTTGWTIEATVVGSRSQVAPKLHKLERMKVAYEARDSRTAPGL